MSTYTQSNKDSHLGSDKAWNFYTIKETKKGAKKHGFEKLGKTKNPNRIKRAGGM
jgi:hypothetical protein